MVLVSVFNTDVYIPFSFVPIGRFYISSNDNYLQLIYYNQDSLDKVPENIIEFLVNCDEEKSRSIIGYGIDRPIQ